MKEALAGFAIVLIIMITAFVWFNNHTYEYSVPVVTFEGVGK